MYPQAKNQKEYISVNFAEFSIIIDSPAFNQAWAITFPSGPLATPKESCEEILRRFNIFLAASELTRHLFFHGETSPALIIAVLISSRSAG